MFKSKNWGGGVFCGSSVLLMQLLDHFKTTKTPINEIDASGLWGCYKSGRMMDLYKMFYQINENITVDHTKAVNISLTDLEPQFSDYNKLNFEELTPYIQKYFNLSQNVKNREIFLRQKYNITNDMCAVMYRGNDKCTETNVPSYSDVIDRAKQFKMAHPNVKFFIQTDEHNFLQEFLKEFPDTVYIEEIPRMHKNVNTCIPYVMDQTYVLDAALYYTASIHIMSQMDYVITTSGNGESWIAYFRGHSNGIIQYLNPLNPTEKLKSYWIN